MGIARLPWIKLRGMTSRMKLSLDALTTKNVQPVKFTVYPYLKDYLSEDFFRDNQGQSVDALMEVYGESLMKDSIDYFIGDSFLADEGIKMAILKWFRDALFRTERQKPRIIAPDKRGKHS
ncbi:hypothetical protein [Roseofilum sp. Belize Diploria]|uniref:hypothetical protein n=1 Tax=Roseofilum sp. Belize Diploria TaxID=2821501 RepID=UPI001B022F61|nr:hypothetical protein [Roseofilum sp. Belize Diploria]MBP0010117.1 hypothetical protein [Roseofilum sp. Belize Diploria]